jgi:hypothetical protein
MAAARALDSVYFITKEAVRAAVGWTSEVAEAVYSSLSLRLLN